MQVGATYISREIAAYVSDHSSPLDSALQDLAEETRSITGRDARMQIAPEQAQLLTLLARQVRPKLAVEVGTFTGMSALSIARGLEPGARLITCDVNEDWAKIALRHWEKAGIADRVELRIGPALETLRSLPAEPGIGMAFIDADKENYVSYYEEILRRLEPGGLMVIDNVLWSGRVTSPSDDSETKGIQALNKLIREDDRVVQVMLSVADGMTLAMRR